MPISLLFRLRPFGHATGKRWKAGTPADTYSMSCRPSCSHESISNWNAFSNSSPVEGLEAAVGTFAARDKRISIYVFGDEFTGPSIEAAVRAVDRLNLRDPGGEPRVRIHAVGFPVMFSQPGFPEETGVRFAALMRIVCQRNGGTFVGLTEW